MGSGFLKDGSLDGYSSGYCLGASFRQIGCMSPHVLQKLQCSLQKMPKCHPLPSASFQHLLQHLELPQGSLSPVFGAGLLHENVPVHNTIQPNCRWKSYVYGTTKCRSLNICSCSFCSARTAARILCTVAGKITPPYSAWWDIQPKPVGTLCIMGMTYTEPSQQWSLSPYNFAAWSMEDCRRWLQQAIKRDWRKERSFIGNHRII